MKTLEFRDVKDGDLVPIRASQQDVYWPAVFQWICPSLTEDEAREVYERGGGSSVSVVSLRRLITEWAVTK